MENQTKGTYMMLDIILKVSSLFLNAMNIVLKTIELMRKMKNEHQKSNRPDQS